MLAEMEQVLIILQVLEFRDVALPHRFAGWVGLGQGDIAHHNHVGWSIRATGDLQESLAVSVEVLLWHERLHHEESIHLVLSFLLGGENRMRNIIREAVPTFGYGGHIRH